MMVIQIIGAIVCFVLASFCIVGFTVLWSDDQKTYASFWIILALFAIFTAYLCCYPELILIIKNWLMSDV